MKTNGWKFWVGLFLVLSPIIGGESVSSTGDAATDFGQSLAPFLMVVGGLYLWYKDYKENKESN